MDFLVYKKVYILGEGFGNFLDLGEEPAVFVLVKGDCKLAQVVKIIFEAGEGNMAFRARVVGRMGADLRPAPNALIFCTPDCTPKNFPTKNGLRFSS